VGRGAGKRLQKHRRPEVQGKRRGIHGKKGTMKEKKEIGKNEEFKNS